MAVTDRDVIHEHIIRVEVQADQLAITLAGKGDERDDGQLDNTVLHIPWKKTAMRRRRDILAPVSACESVRPIRAEMRVALVTAIARGRRWLDELISGTAHDVDQIAAREKYSVRQVNMMISLAFLSPRLVNAAIDGRLPRGVGIARLRDASAEWSRQHAMLGLAF